MGRSRGGPWGRERPVTMFSTTKQPSNLDVVGEKVSPQSVERGLLKYLGNFACWLPSEIIIIIIIIIYLFNKNR